MFVLPPNTYDRNHDIEDIGTFKLNRRATYRFCWADFVKTYPNSKEYVPFLRELRKNVVSQLLSDHRLKKYCFYKMIDSGALDDHGCLIPSAMKKLRPK